MRTTVGQIMAVIVTQAMRERRESVTSADAQARSDGSRGQARSSKRGSADYLSSAGLQKSRSRLGRACMHSCLTGFQSKAAWHDAGVRHGAPDTTRPELAEPNSQNWMFDGLMQAAEFGNWILK